MFHFMKKDKDKEDKDKKKKKKSITCTQEELTRLEEARRSVFGIKKKKGKLSDPALVSPNGDLDAVGHNGNSAKKRERIGSLAGHSDSSETSLSSLHTRSPEEDRQKKPDLPPKPPKRGILKGKAGLDSKDTTAEDTNVLVKNTLANELIVYENVQRMSDSSLLSPTKSTSQRGSASPGMVSQDLSTCSPSPEMPPIGEGFGVAFRSKSFQDLDLHLPSLTPPKPPKARVLTIYRQPKGDFGFSLRRAAIVDRGMGSSGAASDVVDSSGDRKRTIIFAEPGSVGRFNDTGLLPGDRLLEVNGVSVEDCSREEIVELIKSSSDCVSLRVQPVPELSELTLRLAVDGHDVELDENHIRTGTLTRSGSRRFKKDMAKSEDQLATERAWLDAEKVWLVHKGGFSGARQLKASEAGSPLPEGRVKVKLDYNGEFVVVDEEDVEKANPPQFDRTEDLAQLNYLNGSSVVHTVRQRYGSNLIHTYAGGSMVVVNPLHPLAIYSEKVIQMFKGCKQEDMPPHIYAAAQTAYSNMVSSRANQSMVLLGRSGSGKTTNFRHILHYLAYSAGTVNKIVTVEKLNAISTLMEAFGNSRTVMNTNATRFTEVFSLDFDHTGQIANASIQVLLLEKTRVVRRPEGEPTFHIFYQMLSGVDDQLRKELMLEHLTEPNLFMTPLQRLEDKQKASMAWVRIQAAMDLLGIQAHEAKAIWCVLAAIYHLGVAGVTKGSGSGRAQFNKPQNAQRAASLLGITEEELARTIFNPNSSTLSARASFRTVSPSERAGMNDRPADVQEALEGLVIGLYYESFNALLSLINRTIGSSYRTVSSILVVDSPGFQNPATCGRHTGATFEDLCYNYAQERLQLLFYEQSIVAQQDRYAQEQIDCNLEELQLEMSSPAMMINLIDKPSQQALLRSSNLDLRNTDQRGLLWLLDEEAIFPGSTDESFLDRLFIHYNERDYKQFVKKGSLANQFVLQHFQGTNPVTYNASGWLRTCRENSVIRAAASLLQESQREPISKLFVTCRGPVPTTISGSVVGIEGMSSLRRVSSARRGYTANTAGIKRKSLCLQVKFQEDSIIETLNRTRQHFVHCVMPQHNAGLCDLKASLLLPINSKSSDEILLNVPLVRSQIHGAQILDAVRMHKQGFPEHLQFSEFRHRFELLAPPKARSSSPILDERQAVENLLQHLDVDRISYRLGLSKIFFRPGALAQLEEQRNEKLQGTVVRFQAYCRGHLGRKKLQKLKVQDLAIRCIQRNVQKFLAVRSWPWWRLMVKIRPLLDVHRTEEELRAKEQELVSLKAKAEKYERECGELKHENDKLEAKLSELNADLSEEHSTSTHAAEMLEAETADRLRLEKDLKDIQSKYEGLKLRHEQLEMEAMEARMYRASEMNGTLGSDDEDSDASVYKQKYERACRELEFMKKRLQQQHEEEMDKHMSARKQVERKLGEALDDIHERSQAAAQWKRKSQRFMSELNDLKLLLDEQTTRNALLEKKQRKFDGDLTSAHDEVQQERLLRERLQRERDQLQGEKYTFEQDLLALKLDLEMKDEKLHSLNKELDELTFGSKGDEELALLKRSKHELDLKVKDQDEELDDLAGQVQMLEQAKLRLEMSLENLRKENRKEISAKDEEIEETRTNAHKKVKALEQQLETEHDERQSLTRERHELERRLVELQERPAAPAHDAETVQRLRRDLRRTKALLRDAQTMLEHSREDGASKTLIRQLKNQLEDAEFAKTAAIKARTCAELELQDLQAILEDVTRGKNELDQKCQSLTRERSELQSQQEENEEELADVMKRYKAAVQQQSVLQTQVNEQGIQISDLELERNLLKDQLNDLHGKLEVLEGESVDAQLQKRLEHRVKELESRLELEETTRKRLETQLNRVKENYEKLEVDCDSLRAKEQQAQESVRKFQRQIRDLKEDKSELQQKEVEAAHRCRDLEVAMQGMQAENQSVKTDLKLAFKRIEDLQLAMTDNIGNDSNASDSEGSASDSDSSLETFLMNHRHLPVRSRLGSSASTASMASSATLTGSAYRRPPSTSDLAASSRSHPRANELGEIHIAAPSSVSHPTGCQSVASDTTPFGASGESAA